MRVTLFACAGSAVIDQRTNTVTLQNVVEQYTAPNFPIAPPMTIVGFFSRKKNESEKGELSIRMNISSQKKPLLDHSFVYDFQGKLRSRLLINIFAVVIPSAGTLSAHLIKRGKVLADWEVEVVTGNEPPKVFLSSDLESVDNLAVAKKSGARKSKSKGKSKKNRA